jgi:hypothetical protein
MVRVQGLRFRMKGLYLRGVNSKFQGIGFWV